MKAFVTGGSGHIGYHLVRDLLDQVHQVKVLVNSNVEQFKGLNVELVTGDLLIKTEMESLMQDNDLITFAKKLEDACVYTIESGQMTKDLALLIKSDSFLNTDEFLDAVEANLLTNV